MRYVSNNAQSPINANDQSKCLNNAISVTYGDDKYSIIFPQIHVPENLSPILGDGGISASRKFTLH
jgi:hypothetical protein